MSRRGRRRHAHGCGAEPLHALRHRVLAPAPLHLRGPLWTRLAGRRSSFRPGWTMLTRLESSGGRRGGSRSAADADRLRSHRAARPLVGAAAPHRRRSRHVRGLHDLGGVPGRALPIWKLSIPLLLTRALRIGQRVVRAAPGMVAGMAGLLAGAGHPLGARRLPSDLLLLPGRLLQGLLGRPALDVWKAMWFPGPSGPSFGIGVGTLVLLANTILLGGYALGCHSLRHLAGGALDRLSGAPVRKFAYYCFSCLIRRNMAWAWTSLFGVALSDLYVRLCAMGVIRD